MSQLETEHKELINEATKSAEAAPYPSEEEALTYVYEEEVNKMTKLSYLEAIQNAQDLALNHFSNAFILGDVGKRVAFSAQPKLQSKYGDERVIDTPLAESNIIGTAIGAAMLGKRPIAEIQFADFILPATNQIISEAAKMRYRSNNDWNCPLTIRAPFGGGVHGGLYHSQSVESIFASTPGLTIVIPSSYDAKGLLLSSIESNDQSYTLNIKAYRFLKRKFPKHIILYL